MILYSSRKLSLELRMCEEIPSLGPLFDKDFCVRNLFSQRKPLLEQFMYKGDLY